MVIVCDCQYRSSITAIRSFHKEGEEVIAVTVDTHKNPPSFSSKYVKEKLVLSSDTQEYTEQLLSLCKKYKSPILFPTGNFTLNIISENLERFKDCAKFCVSDKNTLDLINDKKWVKEKAEEFGIAVPKLFNVENANVFPLVVKPFCGEKFGLKAADRYKIVHNREELERSYNFFKEIDNSPIIEEYIIGNGVGVSVVSNNSAVAQTAFCHKRIVEYPINGGPSAYLETFYDEKLISTTVGFLEHICFKGIAMVEYKQTPTGFYLLEINPRVWGSFAATESANSDFIKSYIRACNSNTSTFTCKYEANKKIKFTRGLSMAFLSNLKKGNVKNSFKILGVILSPFINDATFNFSDILPHIRDFFRR